MRFELSNGALQAAVQARGGELISLRDSGNAEYIWSGDPAFWSGRNPILFPIVGALRNGRVDIGGKSCEMARHGFARTMDFTPVDRGDDFIVLELRETAETLARYPYPFSLRVRHRLLQNGFSTTFSVKNTGAAPMPFCIGAHTAIRCPLEDRQRFEDYQLVFDRPEEAASLLLTPEGLIRPGADEVMLSGGSTLPLDYETFRRMDTLIFQNLRSTAVSLLHRKTGRGVRLDFSSFPMVAFWTRPGAPFLCLEPWQGCAALENETGRFKDKPHVITLSPGEGRDLTYTVTLAGG